MDLKDRVIIVTGAGRGIGKVCASTLATNGAKLAVVDINSDHAEQSAREIEAADGECIPIAADISLEGDTLRMVEMTVDRYGRIDVLINNAAIWNTKSFDEISVNEWDLVMAVNLRGTFLSCKAVYPIMRKQGYGKIINIASTVALFGSSSYLHYVTSKAGIIGLTRALAREIGKYGIRVNALAPGLTETEGALAQITRERFFEMASQTVLKRVAKPEDLAGTILFLASPESDFMTGQTMVVDGGFVFH
jgi:3-oxoacyl-[acyl-carrier protein] reductase